MSLLNRFLIISCQKYSELLSLKLDTNKLELKEELSFKIHHVFCLFCRRYNRQISLIDKIAKKDLSSNSSNNHCHIPEDSRERIKKALREKKL